MQLNSRTEFTTLAKLECMRLVCSVIQAVLSQSSWSLDLQAVKTNELLTK